MSAKECQELKGVLNEVAIDTEETTCFAHSLFLFQISIAKYHNCARIHLFYS